MGVVKYTGPVASFHCPTNAEIRNLKVHFSPKQEGTGDPSPENIRPIVGWDGVEVYKTGKNLFNRLTIEDGYIYQDGSVVLDSGASKHSALIPVSAGNTYVFSGYKTKSSYVANKRVHGYNENGVWVKQINYYSVPAYTPSASYNVVFTINSDDNIKYVKLSFENKDSNIQLELGSTPTSYEPYHDEIVDYEFGVLGKNKFNPEMEWTFGKTYTYAYLPELENLCNISFTLKDSTVDVSDVSVGFSYYEPNAVSEINKGYRWCLGNGVIKTYAKTNTVRDGNNTEIKGKICTYLVVNSSSQATFQDKYNRLISAYDIQIEYGDTATTYEPYNPNKTVYGGWVDLISGKVCEEWFNVEPSQWEKYNESNGYYAYRLNGIPSAENYSSTAGVQKLSNIISHYGTFNSSNMNKNIIQYPYFLALQQDISIEMVEYIYKLATPVTYQLAPTELQTFLGQNSVWSNADYVEVEYDLHETQEILNRKAFIMANQPHLVAPEAAQLQSFTTDLVAPLKECKVYFAPKQEGEGDPSPDNVRAINGWTGVEVYQSSNAVIKTNNNDNWEVGYLGVRGQMVNNKLYRTSDYFEVNTDDAINLSFVNSTTERPWYCFAVYDAQKNFINRSAQWYADTIRRVLNYSDIAYARLSLNIASNVMCYVEPVTTIPITFPTEAGTIYGGYVDLIKGEIVITDMVYEITNVDYINNAGNTASKSGFPNMNGIYYPRMYRSALCSHYNNNLYDIRRYCLITTTGIFSLGINAAEILGIKEFTIEAINTWLEEQKNNGTPLQCGGPLVEPLIYQIDPIALKTLRGQNNIWSSANDNIEIKYWKH